MYSIPQDKNESSSITNDLSTLTTDEAGRFQNFLLLLLLAPQVGKSVDDDTKDKVENNDDDHEEEQQVVNHSGSKQWLLFGWHVQRDTLKIVPLYFKEGKIDLHVKFLSR